MQEILFLELLIRPKCCSAKQITKWAKKKLQWRYYSIQVRQFDNQAISNRKIDKQANYIYKINRYEEIISQRLATDQKCRSKNEAEQ